MIKSSLEKKLQEEGYVEIIETIPEGLVIKIPAEILRRRSKANGNYVDLRVIVEHHPPWVHKGRESFHVYLNQKLPKEEVSPLSERIAVQIENLSLKMYKYYGPTFYL